MQPAYAAHIAARGYVGECVPFKQRIAAANALINKKRGYKRTLWRLFHLILSLLQLRLKVQIALHITFDLLRHRRLELFQIWQ